MLDWFVQAYQRGPSFKTPIPFTNAQAAIAAANEILRRGLHHRVVICHSSYATVRLDLEAPADDAQQLAETLESQARFATLVANSRAHNKSRGRPD